MKKLFVLLGLITFLGCQKPLPDLTPAQQPILNKPALLPDIGEATVVPGSGKEPAILEATVDSVGNAFISNRTIIVKLPAGYKDPNVRIKYKISEGVRTLSPASGALIPVKSNALPRVCVQQDELGNCQVFYEIRIEMPSPLKITADPGSQELELTQFAQPYELTFGVDNLNAGTPARRWFSIRFVNNKTKVTYTGDNYMVYDLNGNPVFVNATGQQIPSRGKLKLTGTLPVAIIAGDYTMTILSSVCNEVAGLSECIAGGIESVDIPLTIKAGLPIVGETNPSAPATGAITITGRNLEPTKPIAVRLTNDFSKAVEGAAFVVNSTAARLALPPDQPSGQYRLDITPVDGKPYKALFTIPSSRSSQSFAYVGPSKNYNSTSTSFDWMPILPTFKGGDALEMRYTFTSGDLSYMASYTRTVKSVRMIYVTNPDLIYELTNQGIFRPYALATDFVLWKWKLPMNPQKGDYTLVFEDFDGSISLPFYQKIRIE